MQEFTIKYKQSYAPFVVTSVVGFFLSPLAVLMFIGGLETSNYDWLLASLLLFSMLIWLWGYTVLLVLSSRREEKVVELKGGVLMFPKSNLSRVISEVALNSISQARLFSNNNINQLNLKFVSDGQHYMLDNSSMSEKDFSILCNAIIKRSDRCKACQSSQVYWTNEIGHCSNCETITPKNADEFDWKNAYQA